MGADNSIILIGYSGHGFVACDVLTSTGNTVVGYCDQKAKDENPFGLKFLGFEKEAAVLQQIEHYNYFVAIGDNVLRKATTEYLIASIGREPNNALHLHSVISSTSKIGSGVMINAGAVINALAEISNGAICNTGAIIEHECKIGEYAHIAPGAVLCGNVMIGDNTFVGANSVVKEGVKIGKDVIIGAGTVVTKDIPNNVKVAGNPYKKI